MFFFWSFEVPYVRLNTNLKRFSLIQEKDIRVFSVSFHNQKVLFISCLDDDNVPQIFESVEVVRYKRRFSLFLFDVSKR